MKWLLALTFLLACSKSSTTVTTVAGPSVTVKSVAAVSGILTIVVNIVQSSHYQKLTLIIFKTSDVAGESYQYPLVIKDGDQVILFDKFSDISPMYYQIEYDTTFSGLMQLTY